MSNISKIEWTDSSWNPVRGCIKISPGCAKCYAERFAERWRGIPGHAYEQGFDLRLVPEALKQPAKWKKPRKIFVNSMSDLFLEDIPLDYIHQVFKAMNDNPKHIFQILTKRSERLNEVHGKLRWTKNIWMGVSVENNDYIDRINDLYHTDAHIKFVSFEPLLGPITLPPGRWFDWAIVGGESGPGCRRMDSEWAKEIMAYCTHYEIPFFLKQLGGHPNKRAGDKAVLLDKTWTEFPK